MPVAFEHGDRVMLGRATVNWKADNFGAFAALPDRIDIAAGAVVTTDPVCVHPHQLCRLPVRVVDPLADDATHVTETTEQRSAHKKLSTVCASYCLLRNPSLVATPVHHVPAGQPTP